MGAQIMDHLILLADGCRDVDTGQYVGEGEAGRGKNRDFFRQEHELDIHDILHLHGERRTPVSRLGLATLTHLWILSLSRKDTGEPIITMAG